jgi:NAD(P)-dependent dehydrogenase (short-subunit alcohol dehydrogenase family)
MFYFKSKVAIVTGGGNGIGRAICMELGRKGALVIVADPSIELAREVAAAVAAAKGSARAVKLDIDQTGSLQTLVDSVLAEEKRVDFMFNSAGSFFDHPARMQNVEDLRHQIDISEWSIVYGTTAAYQVMLRQGFGHIINTSSAAGFSNEQSIAGYAVSVFSTTLRGESANLGVKVSVICPKPKPAHRDVRRADQPALARIILRGVEQNRAFIPVDAPALAV